MYAWLRHCFNPRVNVHVNLILLVSFPHHLELRRYFSVVFSCLIIKTLGLKLGPVRNWFRQTHTCSRTYSVVFIWQIFTVFADEIYIIYLLFFLVWLLSSILCFLFYVPAVVFTGDNRAIWPKSTAEVEKTFWWAAELKGGTSNPQVSVSVSFWYLHFIININETVDESTLI